MMSASELFSALRWLDVHATVAQVTAATTTTTGAAAATTAAATTPTSETSECGTCLIRQVHEAVRRLDADADGFLTADDFVGGFASASEEASADSDGQALPVSSPLHEIVIPLQRIPEIHSADGRRGSGVMSPPSITLSEAELKQFVACVRTCPGYKAAARELCVGREGSICVWQPLLERGGGMGVTRAGVVLGHCATNSPRAPGGKDAAACPLLELRDERGSGFRGDASARLQAPLLPLCRSAVVGAAGLAPLLFWRAVSAPTSRG